MPEYILYDKDGKKHTYFHMVDVRSALETGLYSAERPEKFEPERKKKTASKSKSTGKSKFNITEVEVEKTQIEKIRDEVHTKTDIDKIEEKVKEKKS